MDSGRYVFAGAVGLIVAAEMASVAVLGWHIQRSEIGSGFIPPQIECICTCDGDATILEIRPAEQPILDGAGGEGAGAGSGGAGGFGGTYETRTT